MSIPAWIVLWVISAFACRPILEYMFNYGMATKIDVIKESRHRMAIVMSWMFGPAMLAGAVAAYLIIVVACWPFRLLGHWIDTGTWRPKSTFTATWEDHC